MFCALLYGRNGSGKSAIARDLRRLVKSEDDSISSVALLDETKTSLNEKLDLLNRFNNNKDKISLGYYKFRIDKSLRYDNSLPDRDRLLTVNKNNTAVNADTFKLFIDVISKAPINKLLIKFYKKYYDFWQCEGEIKVLQHLSLKLI